MVFYDLNINVDNHHDQEALKETLVYLMKLGYDSVALTHTVEGKITPKDINKINKIQFEETQQGVSGSGWMRTSSSSKNIKQYTRLEVICKHVSDLQILVSTNPVVSSYDIISVVPLDQDIFHNACISNDIDIISLNTFTKYPIKPDRVRQCISKGILIELNYSLLFEKESDRTSFFQIASGLVRSSFGKNIILSSKASNSKFLRSPYDISNIGNLFGLTFDQAKDTVSKNPHSVVMNSLSRKSKGIALVYSTKELQDLELWKLERKEDITPTNNTIPHEKHKKENNENEKEKETEKEKEKDIKTTTTSTSKQQQQQQLSKKVKKESEISEMVVDDNNKSSSKSNATEKRKRN